MGNLRFGQHIQCLDSACLGHRVYHLISEPTCVFPQIKAIGVLTSNKEGEVICEIDGLVLGGVQFGVLV